MYDVMAVNKINNKDKKNRTIINGIIDNNSDVHDLDFPADVDDIIVTGDEPVFQWWQRGDRRQLLYD